MSYIVDRRLNGKKKSTVNRQRFLQRYRKHIKKAVEEAVTQRSITDMEQSENISIPKGDTSEPHFRHSSSGRQNTVNPGNKEFTTGDQIQKPQGGQGNGSGEGDPSNEGEGTEDFIFQINQNEFLEFLFDDLALPNMLKRHLTGADAFKYSKAGYTATGNPSKLNVVRSMKQATSRRIALTATSRKKLRQAENELEKLQENNSENSVEIQALEEKIKRLRSRIKKIPFIDDIDLRYNLHVKVPKPTSKAVMFCLMDVSGSMDQSMKDLAKRFFILLYMFLKRNYKKIDVVFIRHHTSAKEVDEQDFFYSRETGGTIVSSALKLMDKVLTERYPANEWNIYAAQASDGDNWSDDSPLCRKILEEKILPLSQYFAYIEICARRKQALWDEYERIKDSFPEHFAMQEIQGPEDIFPVFKSLFKKQGFEAA